MPRTAAELSQLREQVFDLKNKLNAIIVAHNYQVGEVQDVADFVGDSYELARLCGDAKAKTIVFCGVDFMAETAAILSPDAMVLLSAATACCPMANMITEKDLNEWKAKYPQAAVVSYVNTSAAIKAGSDICCTSANAVKVVESLPDNEILFVPDQNLGHFVSTQTKKRIILYPGFCATHAKLTADDVKLAKQNLPDAKVIVHPECRPEVIALADAALSTSQMIRYVQSSPADSFLIGTEEGLLHRLHKDNPEKKFFVIASSLICPNMKKTKLENVIETMQTKANRITVPEDIRIKAKRALDRMLAVK
ncbi:MAG: quinolinate synthase NadA [Dehalococcoidales bacterium]|nr:quinolinate synthase NadA [Dehalococcoidales bacterium]